eukprot:1532714-Karenia_brevis.AAC.1
METSNETLWLKLASVQALANVQELAQDCVGRCGKLLLFVSCFFRRFKTVKPTCWAWRSFSPQ